MKLGNVGKVIKYEIISMLRKPSYWFFTFLFPLMIMAFTFVPQIFVQRTMSEASQVFTAAARRAGGALCGPGRRDPDHPA